MFDETLHFGSMKQYYVHLVFFAITNCNFTPLGAGGM